MTMTSSEALRFEEAHSLWQSEKRKEALLALRALIEHVESPDDKAGLLYHEVMWLLGLSEVAEARSRLDEMKALLARIGKHPHDSDQLSPALTLTVMMSYAEARLLMDEGAAEDAFATLNRLRLEYPKQLSHTAFETIRADIPVLEGVSLANQGRWSEARPFLENATIPPGWEGYVAYYLGNLYFENRELRLAEQKFGEAANAPLPPKWKSRAHYMLGLTQYSLSNFAEARKQFELALMTSNAECPPPPEIWEWLENTSRALGLHLEAEQWRKKRLHRLD